MSQLLHIHPETPQQRHIDRLVEDLHNGAVIIYPGDTVFAFACDILQKKAIEKICQLKNIQPEKARLTLLCDSISQVSQFTKQISDSLFLIMKKNTPGPFTFILNSNNQVPKMFKNKKRTVGVRIPNNKIAQALIKNNGRPLLTISVPQDEEGIYESDARRLYEKYKGRVDYVIEGSEVSNELSTIVDCTNDYIEIIRQSYFELDL